MKPTSIMTHKKWVKDTSAFFAKGRSTGENSLTYVDNALLMYENSSNNQWPRVLKNLRTQLENWIESKTVDGDIKTKRSHKTIALLKSQIDEALKGKDAEIWSGDYPPIYVSNDAYTGGENIEIPTTWKGRVEVALGELNSNPCGSQLLTMLSQACERKGKRVVIVYGNNQCAPCTIETVTDNEKRLNPKVSEWMSNANIVQIGINKTGEKPKFVENEGACGLVLFNPDHPAGPDGERPTWVALGHELIHAYHYVTGTCARALEGSTNMNSGCSEEEMQTIGTRGYDGQVPSENWLRASASVPDRTRYSGYDFSDTICTLTA
jgi:hypothetical protein